MSSPTNANDPAAYNGTVTVSAQPARINAGGIVLLTVDLPTVHDTYELVWDVVGSVRLSQRDTHIALLGATTVTGGQVTLPVEPENQLQATLDTSPLTVGSWRVRVQLTKVDPGDEAEARVAGDGPNFIEGTSEAIEVMPRPSAAGDDVAVTMRRTAVPPTSDQALWVAIGNSANAIGFENYNRFIDVVVCGEFPDQAFGRLGSRSTGRRLHKVKYRTALPFPNVDRYRLLKAATEVFLMIHCGVDLDDFTGVDLDAESRRLNRTVDVNDLEGEMRSYLRQVSAGNGEFLQVLPTWS